MYLVMSEPGVCEPEVDRTALFLEFCVAFDKSLQRLRAKRRKRSIKARTAESTSRHTHSDLFSNISTTEVINAGT